MSYQVLARKWRPQHFADVVGQEHVLTALSNALSLGRIHHAYLFSGTRGVGKTSIGRLLAKGLNCETGITATPCGQCANCQDIEQGRFVDLLEIDAASRTKVEDTREILDNIQYLPTRGRFKVYLIDEVHMLSRNSFNALLKTLEEPPEHVKFLLATTDPQKLPVTILSRCLQFHLKALDAEQIRTQLEKILSAENIVVEHRALQILARAADGSVRDALSLTDQAIAMGNGAVTTDTVAQMLGALDDEQPLALVEALMNADGAAMMAQVQQAASNGIDWDNLLVETLGLLHQVAMLQLLPSAIDGSQYNEQRLRRLAHEITPQDLQLYYQTLLVGRKELGLAPDRRMGVEMTLLRALAFHPKKAVTVESSSRTVKSTESSSRTVKSTESPSNTLPNATAELLKVRDHLRKQQDPVNTKKSEPVAPAISVLERLSTITERKEKVAKSAKKIEEKEAYRWKSKIADTVKEEVVTPKALRTALEYEKTPELIAKLIQEATVRDPWAAEIEALTVPRLAKHLALSAFKEIISQDEVCLHLRSEQRHLNSNDIRQTLADAMSEHAGKLIKLTIIEDDDLKQRTPLEWRQAIYEEKLVDARKAIQSDINIQSLCRHFDAELDEESIQPV